MLEKTVSDLHAQLKGKEENLKADKLLYKLRHHAKYVSEKLDFSQINVLDEQFK